MSKIDLHLHSFFSDDGQLLPEELVRLSIQEDTDVIAIADHDNINGVELGLQAAKKAGITMIPAIEISCMFEGVNLHILGYNIDHKAPIFKQHYQGLLDREGNNGEMRMEIIESLGIKLDRPLVRERKNNFITGELIAETALADPRNDDNELLKPYRPGGSRGDSPHVNFYWDYLSQGKPAYVEAEIMDLTETIAMIQNTKGKAILAHPGNNKLEDNPLLDRIIASGVLGVEAISSYHNEKQNEYYFDYCIKNDLLITCGSDFHGKYKPTIKIGSTSRDIVKDVYLPKLLD